MTSHSNCSDTEKLASLMEKHMGLVFLVVKMFSPSESDYDEYVNLGRIGLWKAIEKYDKSKSKFSTFACSRIKFEIMRHIHSSSAQKTFSLTPDTALYCDKTKMWEYLPDLTDIESEIISMRANGHSFKDIASNLGIPVHSVRYKFKCIVKKIKDAHV